ncbi:FliA/WhiG family RNA polymerase sigma factor [Falsibacillus pallidus]|uniref:RNA polymerase sigma-28 (SigD/FliA/WhiG) subunit n=1 Tax=Falsibacillus pallidus TaxID=493781 RepID=A0A370GUS1_9BACI|nr:FliA/WhiG family RNA polymerase sigma factor [Falsibacillus pallidus]RDI47432.1 RNA polymerase sigma-28 (SigD/FliA/WhiG) subunit [Falsibacillus pallidus]
MTHVSTLEEHKLWNAWIYDRDTDAGDILVKKYLPLVSFHVQRISAGLPRSVSKEDLKSLGMMGLLDALNKFDPTRDLKFDTYASFRIRGAILDGLRKEDWLPRSTREKAKKIEQTIEYLEQKNMKTPSIEEISLYLDMPEEEVTQTMSEHFFANVLSMDEQTYENEDKDGQAYAIKDERVLTPEAQLIKEEWIEDLSKVILTLNEKEQLVLSLFYQEELTLTEIGEILNLSTSRISQIHSKALFKLRKTLTANSY